MTYPSDIFFDIETLVNVAQPKRILLVGDCTADFLTDYTEQKALLNQTCSVTHIESANLDSLWQQDQRFDVAIVAKLFEHLDKQTGAQVLSRLRDVLSAQYCICLPISAAADSEHWHITELFGFALSKVSSYASDNTEYGLFKYNITDYKKTPDWLNADNWANPEMWGKYWW